MKNQAENHAIQHWIAGNLLTIPLLLLSLTFLGGCAGTALQDGEGGSAKQAPDPHFYQHWLNAYEEETAGGPIVFRAKDSMAFPPSRFRMAYVFNTDGSCQYRELAANDAHAMRDCVFTKVGNKVYLYDEAGNVMPELSFTLAGRPEATRLLINKGIAPQSKPAEKKPGA